MGYEVERCIKEIIVGPRSEEFKKIVAEFKWAAWVAVADGGSSGWNIQNFVDEIIENSRTSLWCIYAFRVRLRILPI